MSSLSGSLMFGKGFIVSCVHLLYVSVFFCASLSDAMAMLCFPDEMR